MAATTGTGTTTAESRRLEPQLAELLARVLEYDPDADVALVRRAFEYSCEHHKGQVRRSGEPFVCHPIAVAGICAELRLDSATIAGALLHDVVEDTVVELDHVRDLFGDDVALLVDGVTKLTRISFASREQAQVENYRKMIVAMAHDLRVILARELDEAGITAHISGRAKHFYSIYSKMAQHGKEFNEIYDLTAMRVLVDSVKDCYGAIGIIHALWKPMPGRFKDYIAMPKVNLYQSLHTTVVGPQGKPLEIQVRTHDMHQTAEYGVAAHWLYKAGTDRRPASGLPWLSQLVDWQ